MEVALQNSTCFCDKIVLKGVICELQMDEFDEKMISEILWLTTTQIFAITAMVESENVQFEIILLWKHDVNITVILYWA